MLPASDRTGWKRLAALALLASPAAAQGNGKGKGKDNGPSPPTAPRPKIDSAKIQADITTDGLMSHLRAFADIAEKNGGNRAFGFPGYAASVDYVFGQVSNIPGTKAWKQPFSALFQQVESLELRINGEGVKVWPLTYSPSTSKEGVTAEVVAGPEGEGGCDAGAYAGLNVKGKIVLVQRWTCPDGTTLAGRVKPAAKAGAAGVIVYNNAEANITGGTLSAPNPEYVAATFVNLADGEVIKRKLDAGEVVQGYFQQSQTVENRTTENVILETEEGDPKNVVMLGAHLDSVQAGPGINDDASGSSLVLEVFKASRRYKAKNKMRFAWWGAEENGKLGSYHYARNLTGQEADKILAYLNFDMVSRGYFGVGDTDGSAYGSVGPAGSEIIQRLFHEHFEGKGITITPARLTNGSDYAPFWDVLNKPFGYLHTGTGIEQDACYHQACDTLHNANPETITINAKAAAHMLALLAEDGVKLLSQKDSPKKPRSNFGMMGIETLADMERLGERHLGCRQVV